MEAAGERASAGGRAAASAPEDEAVIAAFRWCPEVRAAVLADAVARGDRAMIERWIPRGAPLAGHSPAGPRQSQAPLGPPGFARCAASGVSQVNPSDATRRGDMFEYFVAERGSVVADLLGSMPPPAYAYAGADAGPDRFETNVALVACAAGDVVTLGAAIEWLGTGEHEDCAGELESIISGAILSGRAETVRAVSRAARQLADRVDLPVDSREMAVCALDSARAAVETRLAVPIRDHSTLVDALRSRDDNGAAERLAFLVENGVPAFPHNVDIFNFPNDCVFAHLERADDPAGLAAYLEAVRGRDPGSMYDAVGGAGLGMRGVMAWVLREAPGELVPAWLRALIERLQ